MFFILKFQNHNEVYNRNWAEKSKKTLKKTKEEFSIFRGCSLTTSKSSC